MLITDLDKVNKDGDSFATLLVKSGHVGSMWALTSYASMTWPSPLFYACHTVNLAVVARLVKGGVDLNNEGEWTTNGKTNVLTPLTWSSSRGLADLVRLLLTSPSIDPNRVDAKGVTALILASKNDHAHVVQALAEHELLDLTHGDSAGNTALHHACAFGAVRATQALLACDGICVNQGNHKGQVRTRHLLPSIPPSIPPSTRHVSHLSPLPTHRPLSTLPPRGTTKMCFVCWRPAPTSTSTARPWVSSRRSTGLPLHSSQAPSLSPGTRLTNFVPISLLLLSPLPLPSASCAAEPLAKASSRSFASCSSTPTSSSTT